MTIQPTWLSYRRVTDFSRFNHSWSIKSKKTVISTFPSRCWFIAVLYFWRRSNFISIFDLVRFFWYGLVSMLSFVNWVNTQYIINVDDSYPVILLYVIIVEDIRLIVLTFISDASYDTNCIRRVLKILFRISLIITFKSTDIRNASWNTNTKSIK